MNWWELEAPGHGYCHRNYGLAGGTLDPSKHLFRAGCEVIDFELEVRWMLQWAEFHANWGA